MSLTSRLYNLIPFKSIKRKLFKRYIRQAEDIKAALSPNRQIEFKEICASLYDLINNLPDITSLDFNTLRTSYMRSDMVSSDGLLELILSIGKGDFFRLNPLNNPNVLTGGEVNVNLLEWVSNQESLQLIIIELGELLEESINIHRINDAVPVDIGVHQTLLEDERFNERLGVFYSWEFKKTVLKGFNLITLLMRIYDEGQYGKETYRRE